MNAIASLLNTQVRGAFLHAPRQQRIFAIALMSLAIAIGIATRLVAVFQYVTFDIGPDPDQIRDAFTVMDIWDGKLPVLGPKVFGGDLGGFHLPPLYYYLVFPFTVLGSGPAFHALPNALFSFAAIPLLMVVVYRLLVGVAAHTRLLLSGVAGFWYSLLFNDIFISNFQWNPSSIPFFFLLFSLLHDIECRHFSNRKMQLLGWGGKGATLAILCSLHATALFIMPMVYGITTLLHTVKTLRKKGVCAHLLFPGFGIFVALLLLLPYWRGEVGQGFTNTKAILNLVLASGSDASGTTDVGLLERLARLLLHSLNSVRQIYFWNDSTLYAGVAAALLGLTLAIAFSRFRGNQSLWVMWLSTWGLWLVAATKIDPNIAPAYYRSLVAIAPIIFVVVALAYHSLSGKWAIAYRTAIATLIALSCLHNLYYDTQFLAAKYGPQRLVSTHDVVTIIDQLPTDARICDPRISRKRDRLNKYNYISRFVTQRELVVNSQCQAGDFVIHPKRVLEISGNLLADQTYEATLIVKDKSTGKPNLWPAFSIADNAQIERPAQLVLDLPAARVYRLAA